MAPRIVVFPGAWHSVSLQFAKLTAALGREGLIVHSVPYVTFNTEVGSLSEDAAVYSELIEALSDSGEDVLVVAQSSGGAVAQVAASGLSKIARSRKGKPGGIIGLIFMTAFVIDRGVPMVGKDGTVVAPWLQVNGVTCFPKTPIETFYNECDPKEAEFCAKMLKPCAFSYSTTSSDVTPAWEEAELNGRRVYVICNKDHAWPGSLQRTYAEAPGAKWEFVEMDADHSPFLSKTEESCALIVQKAKEWST